MLVSRTGGLRGESAASSLFTPLLLRHARFPRQQQPATAHRRFFRRRASATGTWHEEEGHQEGLCSSKTQSHGVYVYFGGCRYDEAAMRLITSSGWSTRARNILPTLRSSYLLGVGSHGRNGLATSEPLKTARTERTIFRHGC